MYKRISALGELVLLQEMMMDGQHHEMSMHEQSQGDTVRESIESHLRCTVHTEVDQLGI